MQTFQADLAVIGAGGAGLRAAIAAAQANPNAKIALISKVYPMRSHTVAAEGGSAAVAQDHDSFEYHFHDTVAGGDWLCEQDVVRLFRSSLPNGNDPAGTVGMPVEPPPRRQRQRPALRWDENRTHLVCRR
ncbi:FAD-binding protein [Klebsiella variicola]